MTEAHLNPLPDPVERMHVLHRHLPLRRVADVRHHVLSNKRTNVEVRTGIVVEGD
jgi:hypothetical protein